MHLAVTVRRKLERIEEIVLQRELLEPEAGIDAMLRRVEEVSFGRISNDVSAEHLRW
jgi:hypothetical protein